MSRNVSLGVDKLTYRSLLEGYMTASVGRDEPTELRASPDAFEAILNLGVKDIEYRVFHGAAIVYDNTMPPGLIHFKGGREDVFLIIDDGKMIHG